MFGFFRKKKIDYKESGQAYYAVFHTSLGDFEAELFADDCPETVWNFINLAEGRQETKRSGPFYEGLTFHRVVKGFVIQGGCPKGNGTGGPGYRFDDEIREHLRHDSAGILSMANAGPRTNGSQFFVTLKAVPQLNGKHTVFGKVSKGLDVVERIGQVPVGRGDCPVEPVVINSVTIRREG